MIKIILRSIIFFPKFSFFGPKKKLILVYDNNNFQFFKKYLSPKSYQILFTRNEAYNFPILIKTLIKFGFENLKFNYKCEFIKKTHCKYIITMTDNDLDFLKINLLNIKKIAIQNAYRRDTFPDLFSFLKNEKFSGYNLDYIFCFNKEVGKKYNKYLGCKFIPIGSIRNNLVINDQSKKYQKSAAFISQYRPTSVNQFKNNIFDYSRFIKFIKKPIFNKKNFRNLTYEDFYKIDKIAIQNLATVCKQKKIKLYIIGALKRNFNQEKNFFSKILNDNNWKYIKRSSELSSYEYMDKFNFIFGIDSTMLYEALARKKKVGFISARKSCFKNVNAFYGWPINKSPKGFNWTNEPTYSEIRRIFDNLMYKRESKKNLNEYILFDYKNKIFIKSLKNIITN